jgi:hypothetical protein
MRSLIHLLEFALRAPALRSRPNHPEQGSAPNRLLHQQMLKIADKVVAYPHG